MKNFIITLIALTIVSLQIHAQDDIVRFNSDVAQGYLVLNQLSNVEHWEVSVVRRKFDSKGKFSDKVVEKHTLPAGTNYLKIKANFRVNNENGTVHFASIEGYDKRGAKVIRVKDPITRNFAKNDLDFYIPKGPIGGNPGTIDGCSWVCDGSDYSWNIQQKLIGGGSGIYGPSCFLALEEAYEYFDEENQVAIPYYQYVNYTTWANNCWSYGFGCEAPQYQGVNVIGPFDADENTFYDSNGLQSTGTVVGVRKRLGPWANYNIQTSNIFSEGICIVSGYMAQGFVNDEINDLNIEIEENSDPDDDDVIYIDLLQCDGVSPITEVTELEDENNPFEDCFDNETLEVDTYEALLDVFETYYDCLAEPTASPFNTVLESLSILDINDDSNDPVIVDISKEIQLNPNTTYDEVIANTFKQFLTQSTDPSLVYLGVEMARGAYAPLIVDVSGIDELTTNEPYLRSVVQLNSKVTISPNPSFEGSQTISFQAPTQGECAYELFNLAGQPLEARSFKLDKGQVVNFEISTEKYEAGVLVHKFIFSDGTRKSFRSVHVQ